MAKWFRTEHLKSVKILTGYHSLQNYIENYFVDVQQKIIDGRGKIGTPINIELLFSIKGFDHIHDRFAIIDNELWHFGATVGGLHRDVNAASRGWDADIHGAKDFFNLAWQRSTIKSRKST
ncbi:hypothetical protein D3C76_1302900 [compost metagenome]